VGQAGSLRPIAGAPWAGPQVANLAVTDRIRAVAKERLHERLAEISPSDLLAVEASVRRILELG
jgi:mRNA-degrading endonuclease toxin of MazEF toxin-antitoxin module